MTLQKDELHQLVDALPEEKIQAVREFLEFFLSDGSMLFPEGLMERCSFLERVVDCFSDAILAVEREGKIIVWDRAAERGGRGLHFWTRAAPVYSKKGKLLGAVRRIRETGERKKMEEESKYLDTHDGLTGLYNRTYFEEELRRQEKGRSYPTLREAYKEADDVMHRVEFARRQEPRDAVIRALKAVLAEKDFHTVRMNELACMLGEAVGLSCGEIDALRLLVDMHDIGKVEVPKHIIFKPGPLTEKERKEVERHPEVGYRIALSSGELAPIAEFILQHHEWWNGGGYPRGLQGNQIHLLSRILAIADAYEAMTTDRPYRNALPQEEALAELSRCAGKQFDPHLVKIFVGLVREKEGR